MRGFSVVFFAQQSSGARNGDGGSGLTVRARGTHRECAVENASWRLRSPRTAGSSAAVVTLALLFPSSYGCASNKNSHKNSNTTVGCSCFTVPVVNLVRYYPRAGYADRMNGGRIVGSNVSPTDAFVDLATISQTPPDNQYSELQ